MKLIFLALIATLSTLAAEPPPPAGKQAPLFDGKTLEGWDYDPKVWRVEDGMITGGSLTEKIRENHFICTKKSYQNFDLTLKIKCAGDPKTGLINSGIQIRSVRVPGGAHMSGYQVDCGQGWFGKIYDEFRRNKVIAEPLDAAALDKVVDVLGWNEYRIIAEGPRIRVWINGVAAIDYTEKDPNIALDGQIGPQVHSGGACLVQVKDVMIEELPPTKDAPTWDKVGAPGGKKPAKPKKDPNAYNGGNSGAKTPAEELATFTVPEGLEMELVAAEIAEMGIGKFVAVYFDQKGAMWTMTALEYPVDGNENAAAAEALYASKAKDKILVYDRDPKSPTGFVSKPRVFADGLAIPLGILPYKDGCYVQHGHDLVLLRDTDGDGKADKREVILTGLGVQDSHLFPHQFTRAPGGWIWMAQGLFNNSKPAKPGDDKAVDWPKCSMAKMRMDGSDFEVTSVGPNNIWGLVMTAEGETFIQEANDYGYPVMPFHEYAYYPGGMEAFRKSYQPDFPPAADFRMGGTGLSGLALTDKDGIYPDAWRDVMLVANPIINKVQAIKMHRDGPRWRLEKLGDFVETTDPWFRPVALTLAPDGCVYIVDWYNKIISHNEVPRTHPDRDKTRGRIWRVKPKGKPLMDVPDFTKATGDELIAKLGGASVAQSHLAWQAIGDRGFTELAEQIRQIVRDENQLSARRISAMWAGQLLGTLKLGDLVLMQAAESKDRNVRREAIRAIGEAATSAQSRQELIIPLVTDSDSEVRATAIRSLGRTFEDPKLLNPETQNAPEPRAVNNAARLFRSILSFVHEPLAAPTAKASHGNKTIKIGEAYEREYERFLVRMFLERHPDAVAKFLDTDDAKKLPVEARLLATLALEPKASAPRVAALLPQLTRPPEREEILRLVQFLDEPGVADAVRGTLANPATAPGVLAALLELRSKLDPAKLAPILTDTATKLLASKDAAQVESGVQLAGAFKLASAEPALVALLRSTAVPAVGTTGVPPVANGKTTAGTAAGPTGGTPVLQALRALSEIGSTHTNLFASLATSSNDPLLRDEALTALASSKAADAPQKALALFPKLAPTQRRTALDKLTTTKPGAAAVVAAVTDGSLAKTEIDAATLDRLLAVLGDKDTALNALVESLGTLFRPVLSLDGSEAAHGEDGITVDGSFTVETWIKLEDGINNQDGILGAPGQLDINFFAGQFRVYVFPPLGDVVIAKKPTVAGMWTHVAATRDAAGNWKAYVDGELSATGTKPSAKKLENVKLAWTSTAGGTKGQLAQFRVWKTERTADQIRANFDRGIPEGTADLVFNSDSKTGWGKLARGAKIVKTSDLPPVLSADAAAQLDAKFSKYRALAAKPGDKERGKTAAIVCAACHQFGNTGGQIGPNLSGVGAMGTEAILRNILTPNAAMESGYRIFRVEQRDGSVLDAFFVNEDKDAVIVRLPGAADQRIAKKDIVRTTFLRRSLMPEGLLAGMADQQVSDLFAYLLSLK